MTGRESRSWRLLGMHACGNRYTTTAWALCCSLGRHTPRQKSESLRGFVLALTIR